MEVAVGVEVEVEAEVEVDARSCTCILLQCLQLLDMETLHRLAVLLIPPWAYLIVVGPASSWTSQTLAALLSAAICSKKGPTALLNSSLKQHVHFHALSTLSVCSQQHLAMAINTVKIDRDHGNILANREESAALTCMETILYVCQAWTVTDIST